MEICLSKTEVKESQSWDDNSPSEHQNPYISMINLQIWAQSLNPIWTESRQHIRNSYSKSTCVFEVTDLIRWLKLKPECSIHFLANITLNKTSFLSNQISFYEHSYGYSFSHSLKYRVIILNKKRTTTWKSNYSQHKLISQESISDNKLVSTVTQFWLLTAQEFCPSPVHYFVLLLCQ